MYIGCVGVVLYFQTSSRMEAAYGWHIIVTMLMTTILFVFSDIQAQFGLTLLLISHNLGGQSSVSHRSRDVSRPLVELASEDGMSSGCCIPTPPH